ncbi:MAG: type II secretion system protein N [Pseudomonadota bacterium]
MKRAWRFIALGIAVYIPVLLLTLPVERLTGAVTRQIDGLQIGAVSGSVFAGEAGSLAYQGEELGPVGWRFSPTGLLRGRLEYLLDLRNPDYRGAGRVGLGLNGVLVGHAFDLQLQADRLINTFTPVAISSSGQLRLQLDRFTLERGQARDVTGVLEWAAAELRSPVQLPLGDISCAIENREQDLVARVTQGGALGVAGDITLGPDGRYTIRLLLQPGPEVAPATTGLLEAMLRRQPDGKFLINSTGRI